MKKLIEKYRELILYVFFGVCTTAVSAIVLTALEWVLKPRWGAHSYLFSYAVAFVVSVAFAFVVNKLFVFEQKSWERRIVLREAATFTGARLASFVIDYVLGIVFNDLVWPKADPWFTPKWLALQEKWQLFNVVKGYMPEDYYRLIVRYGVIAVIVMILNYFFSKFIIFKKKEPAE